MPLKHIRCIRIIYGKAIKKMLTREVEKKLSELKYHFQFWEGELAANSRDYEQKHRELVYHTDEGFWTDDQAEEIYNELLEEEAHWESVINDHYSQMLDEIEELENQLYTLSV